VACPVCGKPEKAILSPEDKPMPERIPQAKNLIATREVDGVQLVWLVAKTEEPAL
jgi:hypothetical protein